jgi:hypothetical protein
MSNGIAFAHLQRKVAGLERQLADLRPYLTKRITKGSSNGTAAQHHPYKGFDASVGSTPKVRIQPGSHNNVVPTIGGVPLTDEPLLTLGTSAKIVYVQIDFDASGGVTDCSINSSNSLTPPSDDVNPDGSGTGYQTLFFVDVSVVSEVASVSCLPNVLGSQGCQICGVNILKWGV